MRALVFSGGREAAPTAFDARPLQATDLGSEAWLQKLIYEHPDLLPIEEVDPGAGAVAPLCRELSLPRPQGPVYLDMLGVTRRGRLVLVECKLWRNPQARREVVGQILEYAALLKTLSYGDLSAKVAQKTGSRDPNPLWALAAGRLGLDNEAAFVDAVSASLSRGEFDLLLVGDGIRSEIEAVRGYLEAVMGLKARLALIEIKSLWNADGGMILVPQLAMRTQLVQHRGFDSAPSSLEEAPTFPREPRDGSGVPSPASSANREFWQQFIDEVRFTHPDQPAATHGGNNWARLAMPKGYPHVNVYRSGAGPTARLGVQTKLVGAEGRTLAEGLETEHAELTSLFDQPLEIEWDDQSQTGSLAVVRDTEDPLTADQQLAWLKSTSDAFVSLVRPRLKPFAQ